MESNPPSIFISGVFSPVTDEFLKDKCTPHFSSHISATTTPKGDETTLPRVEMKVIKIRLFSYPKPKKLFDSICL